MIVYSIDFETWSECDLRAYGAYAYAMHPSTRLLMMAWRRVGDPAKPALWVPGDPFPYAIIGALRNGGKLKGWNSIFFERLMWRCVGVRLYGFPIVDDDVWIDTALRAAAANIPRGLDGAAKFVGAPFLKDPDGHKLMLKLTSAKRTPDPSTIDPEEFRRFGEYCKDDVSAEDSVDERLPMWPPMRPWLTMPAIDRRINDRGVVIDAELAEGLMVACKVEVRSLDARMARLTNGRVETCSKVEDLKRWLLDNGVPVPRKEEKKEESLEEEDDEPLEPADVSYRLRKNDIIDLLSIKGMPEHVAEALEMRLDASKISTAKLGKMLGARGPDGRLRGAFLLGGAQQTMRFSSTLAQLHNMPRGVIPDDVLEQAVADGRSGDPDRIRFFWTGYMVQKPTRIRGVLDFASRMLRRVLTVPRRMRMLSGDCKSIEAIATAWLSGQDNIVRAFGEGRDVYSMDAAPIFMKAAEQISKDERQAGKVNRLSLGFGGGPWALIRMAYNYGIRLDYDEAKRRVDAFRADNQAEVRYWDANLQAAIDAVLAPGREFAAWPGHTSWCLWQGALCCRLPSGRLIRYWSPRLEYGKWPDGRPKSTPDLTSICVKGKAVFRRNLWRGLLMENQAQAVSTADILGETIVALEEADFPVMLHCHDQAATEVPEDDADALLSEFKAAMEVKPAWAAGMPIMVDPKVSARFG